MYSEEDINIQCNNFNSAVNKKNIESNASLDHGLFNIKCEFDEEETKILNGVLENQLHENKSSSQIATLDDKAFREVVLKTEPGINDESFEDECGGVKNEIDEKNEEFKTSLDYDLSNVKSEFKEEETKIQFGILELHEEEVTTHPATIISTVQMTELPILLKNESLMCEFCSRCFNSKEKLNIHRRSHTQESYKSDSSVKNWIHQIKSALNKDDKIDKCEKPFKCETCDESFTRKMTLKSHMRIHIGEKFFICETCGKSFTRNISLNNHMRTHTDTYIGKKPFKCETCAKRFNRKINLDRHKRIHRDDKC